MKRLPRTCLALALSVSSTASLQADSFDKHAALQLVQVTEGWSAPTLLPAPINTDGWEDGAYISADGSQLYFAYFQGDLIHFMEGGMQHFERHQHGPARGDHPGFLDVLVSHRHGDGWSEPVRFQYSEPFFAEGGVMQSTEGPLRGFWYMSNKPQQPGGKYEDNIYFNDINIGPPVNTPNRNEGDPHFLNGELFFWLEGQGAQRSNYDIWMAKNLDGDPRRWTEPVRLAAPINTPGTDMQPFLTASGQLYYATGRGGGRLSIYVSTRRGPNEWSEPQPVITVPANQSQIMAVGEPTLTADERSLYFVVIFNKDGVLDCDIATITKTSASATQTPSPAITQPPATNTAPQTTAEKPGATLVRNILQGALQGAIEGAVKGLTTTPATSTPSTSTMSTRTAGETGGHSSIIAPETWIGIGSTISVTVATNVEGAQDGRAVLWDYTVSKKSFPLLYTPPAARVKAEHTGIGVRLRSEQATTVALVVKESNGAQYDLRLDLPKRPWIEREIPWSMFKLQGDSRDPNGRLDPTQILQLIFIDLGGFMGKKGSNRLWLDEVWLVGSDHSTQPQSVEPPRPIATLEPQPSPPMPALPAHRSFLIGLSPWPYDFTATGAEKIYEFVDPHADLVMHHFDWGVPWVEALEGKPFDPHVEFELNTRVRHRRPGQKVYVAIAPQASDRNRLARYWGAERDMALPESWKTKTFDDPDVIRAFLTYARVVITRLQPDYFAYGIEVTANFTEQDPGFDKFLVLAKAVYTTLKREYPTLPVFATLASISPSMDVEGLRRLATRVLPHSDYVALSTYPYFSLFDLRKPTADPRNIPADWLSQWAALAPDKPFAISETAYPAEDLVMPNLGVNTASTPQWQADYVQRLFTDLHALHAEFVAWFVPRDYDLGFAQLSQMAKANDFLKLWRDAGLFDGEGHPRPALTVWDSWLKLPRK